MFLFRSNIIKLTSFSFIVIALVLITLILAESPKVDLKLLPNSSNNLVPKSIKENNSTGGLNLVPTADAQQPNPNAIQTTPNYPSLIGLLAPTLLPGLNSAEQQLTPYQLRNASPQQLQRLRQLQEMQQMQQRGPAASPIGQLIGAFLPVGQNLLGGTGVNQQNNLNNQNPGTLARLLGLSPQQPANNPYLNNNNNNNNARANIYGQPTPNQTPKANLRSANDDTSNNSNDNSSNDSNDNTGENSDDNSEGSSDSSSEDQSQPQQDPSQDPDIQQFNNLQGGNDFPGDLFPKGILSENDLKDIQKSMEEQQKQEAEKQRQQEAEQQGNGENEGDGNTEEDAENNDNSDQSNNDQTNDENSSNDGTDQENANQTEGDAQDDTNSDDSSKKSVSNNGKLNVDDGNSAANKDTGITNLNSLTNKLPTNKPTGYSYNNLKPNNYRNINSNVQYEDDKTSLNNNLNRPSTYSNNLPYNNRNQLGPYPDDLYGSRNRPPARDRFNDLRNQNRLNNRFNDDLPNSYNRNPYGVNNYGLGNSQVDYSPEYNQDNLYNNPNSDSYNPMNNYRPNQLLANHLNRQHGDINNYNYRDRLNDLNDRTRLNRRPNYLNNRNNLGSAVNYEPE